MFGALNGLQNDKFNNSNQNISATFIHGYKTMWYNWDAILDALPNTGIVKYKGDAFAIKEGLKGVHKGNADFTVNFGQKAFGAKLTGFTGGINDITFHGDANVVEIDGEDDSDVYYKEHYRFSGAFYGKDADTIAGRVSGSQDGKDIEVVVGAKKQ